jgi:hypothetical protein
VSTKFSEVQSLFRSIKANGSKLNRWERMIMTIQECGYNRLKENKINPTPVEKYSYALNTKSKYCNIAVSEP